MEVLFKIFLISFVVFNVKRFEIFRIPSLPHFDHEWWGPLHLKLQNDTSIKPFQVHFHHEKHFNVYSRLSGDGEPSNSIAGAAVIGTPPVRFSAKKIARTIQNMVKGKSPGFDGLSFEHLKHAGMILDLQYRLKNHRPFTPPLEGVDFEYGFNTNHLDGWVDYWADQYPFKQQENFLNQFPQFKTNVQGLDIHVLWVKPHVFPNVEVVPLLLLHGWPGSVREFFDTLPLLTAVSRDRDFAVEVIAPSLPGFGFSDAAIRPGLGATEMAVVLRNLMHRLGFKKFYVQGGDWGAYIGLSMATLYPKEVLGYHTNLALSISPSSAAIWVLGSIYPPLVVDPHLAERMYPILSVVYWLTRESGYLHLQATKPDTIGVAMSDTPSGLLTYIYQLFSTGSRKKYYYTSDGGLDELYTRDELIDNLMIYWITNSFTTSSRIYAETLNLRNINMGVFAIPTSVPTWTIHAKDEIFYQCPTMLKLKFPNLLNSTVLDTGGHFLALEKPQVFADGVLNAITAFRRWHLYRKKNKYVF